jgi:citronellol/citronellal dehydrogenase
MAKYGMSMCVLGMAEEFKKDNIGVNALWPRTGKPNLSNPLDP